MTSQYHVYKRRNDIAHARALAEAALGHPLALPEPTPYPAAPPGARSHRELAIALLKERDGHNCYLCQHELRPGQVVIEHIIPLSLGGLNEPSNTALACQQCNSLKGDAFVSIDNDRTPRYHRP